MYCTAISQYSLKPAFGLARVTNGDGPNDKGKRPAGLKPGDAGILFTDGLETADDFTAIANGPKAIADFFAKAPKSVINTKLSLPNAPTPIMRLVSTEGLKAEQKVAILKSITKTAAGKIDFTAKDTTKKTVFDHAYAQGHDVFYNTALLMLKRPISKLTNADVQSVVGNAPARHLSDFQAVFGDIFDRYSQNLNSFNRDTSITQEAANRTALARCAALECVKSFRNGAARFSHILSQGHFVTNYTHPTLTVDDPTGCYIVTQWPFFKRSFQLIAPFAELKTSVIARMRRQGLLKKK